MLGYLESVKKQFRTYKVLGEKALLQISDEQLSWHANEDCNSINVIIKHLNGNMLSRWTDFLTTDGEKEWRRRDEEFEPEDFTRDQLIAEWEEGWACLFSTLDSLTDADLDRTILIRNEGHSVLEAINRQIAHYAYHVGQIVYIAKLCSTQWNSLSIPRNGTAAYNKEMFGK